jgi:hypothetical protein
VLLNYPTKRVSAACTCARRILRAPLSSTKESCDCELTIKLNRRARFQRQKAGHRFYFSARTETLFHARGRRPDLTILRYVFQHDSIWRKRFCGSRRPTTPSTAARTSGWLSRFISRIRTRTMWSFIMTVRAPNGQWITAGFGTFPNR